MFARQIWKHVCNRINELLRLCPAVLALVCVTGCKQSIGCDPCPLGPLKVVVTGTVKNMGMSPVLGAGVTGYMSPKLSCVVGGVVAMTASDEMGHYRLELLQDAGAPDTMCIYVRGAGPNGTALGDTLLGPFRAAARYFVTDSTTVRITLPD